MSNDKVHQLVVISNEYAADSSLLYLNGDNIEASDKQDIVNENYNRMSLFLMKDFVSLETDRQSIYFRST